MAAGKAQNAECMFRMPSDRNAKLPNRKIGIANVHNTEHLDAKP